MRNQDEWVEQLKNNRLARSTEELEAFESALRKLEVVDKSSVALSEIFLAYDDRCEMVYLPNSLNKYIWSFSASTLVQAFIVAIDHLYLQAPEWAYMHLGAILAQDTAYSLFKLEMDSVSQDKRRILAILLAKHADNEEEREFENEENSSLLEKNSLRAKNIIDEFPT